MKTIIFHGPSGSGKDTQIDLLQGKIDFERVGGSLIMNALKEENNPLALQADEYGKKGERYPDEIVYGMFQIWIERIDPAKTWIFTSPVRSVPQIKLFDQLLLKVDRKLDLFIHFTLSEDAAIERMALRTSCPLCKTTYHSKYKPEKNLGYCDNDGEKLLHREDDQPESIKRRLGWYNDDIKPILDEYRSRGILREIDAAPAIPEIHKEVIKVLDLNGA